MIVDIQGVVAVANPKQSFVVKEMSVVAMDSTSVSHWMFKHPTTAVSDAKTNRWLQLYHHGMDTACGDVEYTELPKIMKLLRSEVIYVKGGQKKEVIEQYLPGQHVVEMEDLGCPPLKDLYLSSEPCCIRHMNNYSACSLYKVICLKNGLHTTRDCIIKNKKS